MHNEQTSGGLNLYNVGSLGGKVILLNAPALTGKDYAARYLKLATGGDVKEFKSRIFDIAIAMTGLSHTEFFTIYNNREKKEKPHTKFFGKSPREFMIWISEDVCKPEFGQDYFGVVASRGISVIKGAIFSDSGFPIEVAPIAEVVGASNVYVVRFTRGGIKFESNDSRDFLKECECPHGVNFLDLTNDGTIEEFCNVITNWVISR